MSHYRPNLADLEFNLFDVHRLGDYLSERGDLDAETARDVIREVAQLATGVWADALIDSDRRPPVLEGGEVRSR